MKIRQVSKKYKKRALILLTTTSFIGSIIFTGLSINPTTETAISEFIAENAILSRILFTSLNALTNIVLPFSMGLINLVSIKYMPWYEVALYSILGNYIGYTFAFWIAKRFKPDIQELFTSIAQIDKFESKLKNNERTGGLIAFRFATQGVTDYTSYFLGITSVKWKPFLISMIIAEILIKVPRFYLVHLGYNVNPLYFSGVVALILIGYLLYKKTS